MSLQMATIEILDREAVDPSRDLPEKIEVQFNPKEYTLNKGAQIAEINIPGIDSPILQFIRGQNEKLTLDLFFDTRRPDLDATEALMTRTNERDVVDVRTLTRPVYQLVKIQPRTHAQPRVRFHWGKGISFKAIVESVQQKFTSFSPEGIPLQATLSVTFREYKTLEEQLQELNLQSSDHTKERIVREGETLSGIAAEEYRTPAQWRLIADFEGNRGLITNPRRLTPGITLLIPPLEQPGDVIFSDEAGV